MDSILKSILGTYRRDGLSEFCRKAINKLTNDAITPWTFDFAMPLYVTVNTTIQEVAALYLKRKGVRHHLNDLDLCQYKTSDTIFILGSGGSITDISEQGWSHIDDCDSFGLNFWPIHEFVPTIHIFELPDPRLAPQHVISLMWDLFQYRQDDYEKVPMIMKDLGRSYRAFDRDDVPCDLLNQIYLAGEIRIPWRDTSYEVFEQALHYFEAKGWFDQGCHVRMGLKKRASITYLLFLAVNLGYENVVFCGVDLNDSSYFYDERRDYYESLGVPLPPPPETDVDKTHRTNDPSVHRPIVENIIYSLNETVLKPRGITLYTSTKRSALYPKLPHYDLSP